ncbi:hypothetical protein BU17DRAFT_67251 [Hysterangium stoloniferum]|nr:hypothetical protein BU17DRAFT_67251 [Hysterangium stoloniferum]
MVVVDIVSGGRAGCYGAPGVTGQTLFWWRRRDSGSSGGGGGVRVAVVVVVVVVHDSGGGSGGGVAVQWWWWWWWYNSGGGGTIVVVVWWYDSGGGTIVVVVVVVWWWWWWWWWWHDDSGSGGGGTIVVLLNSGLKGVISRPSKIESWTGLDDVVSWRRVEMGDTSTVDRWEWPGRERERERESKRECEREREREKERKRERKRGGGGDEVGWDVAVSCWRVEMGDTSTVDTGGNAGCRDLLLEGGEWAAIQAPLTQGERVRVSESERGEMGWGQCGRACPPPRPRSQHSLLLESGDGRYESGGRERKRDGVGAGVVGHVNHRILDHVPGGRLEWYE